MSYKLNFLLIRSQQDVEKFSGKSRNNPLKTSVWLLGQILGSGPSFPLPTYTFQFSLGNYNYPKMKHKEA